MSANPLPQPSPFHRCAVAGCEEVATQNHHWTYAGRTECTTGLCAHHHEALHYLYDLRGRNVPLPFFTFCYLASPDKTERRAYAHARLNERVPPPEIEAKQLSFADLFGRQGAYWRALMDQDPGTS